MADFYERLAMLEELAALEVGRRSELERRLHNVMRLGKVTEVDPAKGLVKIAYATDDEGADVVSPWVPWTERAGAISTWNPPSVGEQVQMFSPSGEVAGHSWVTPGGFSTANPAKHDKEGEQKVTVGDSSILITGGKITFTSPEIVLAGNTHLGGEGGLEVHRKTDIDSGGDLAVGHATKVWAV